MSSIYSLCADLTRCLVFLTRLPVTSSGIDDSKPLAEVSWGFPVIGAFVGGIGAVIYGLGHWCGLSPMLAALFAVAAMILVTGALHEDGLADVVDGFGGGADREAKLAIMRDSRLGTYGAIGLMGAVGARVAAAAAIEEPWTVASALVAAEALSRAAMVGLMWQLTPARETGLGAQAGMPNAGVTLTAAIIAFVVAAFVLEIGFLLSLIATVAAAWAVAWLAKKQIGGQTGDVLGAGQQVTCVAVLTVIVAAAG